MILVDTSVWVDHLRNGITRMAAVLADGQVLGHRFVAGEIALGTWRQRAAILAGLHQLPEATIAADAAVLRHIAQHALMEAASAMSMRICWSRSG